MDSLTSNIEKIATKTAHNAEENEVTSPTSSSIQSIKTTAAENTNTNATSIIATTTGNASTTTTKIITSNKKTDLAAISKDLDESLLQHNSISISATDTTIANKFFVKTTATANTTTQSNQFVTPQKPAPTSLKKKRNKFSICLSGKSGTNKKVDGRGDTNNGDHDSSSSLSNAMASNIKTSLSMTSLQPDEKQESRDKIKAKLKVERPYNSLKKNADRNLTNQLAKMHQAPKSHVGNANTKSKRYSWGSGHSSSSLHSSAATLGIGSGKDDLWAAIQTNYNYIMDTNLLDTCKEARYELEGAVCVLDNTLDRSFKLLDENSRSVGSYEDPKELRKWLRDMENKLENSPTLSEATMLTCAELESHLTEHSVLYHEIVSHARVVSACIRAASEKEQKQQKQNQQQQQQHQLPHESYNTDASLIAEQTNSSLSSTDDTTTNTTNTNSTTTTAYSSLSSTATTSGVVCSTATTLSDHQISPNSVAAATITASGHTSKKSDNNSLERLQNRYHLLYLKAFEVQLWLDGLLRKKSSSVGNLTNEDSDSEDIDDSIDYSDDCLDEGVNAEDNIDGATEDDLNDVASDLESDKTNNSLSYNDDLDLQQQQSNYKNHHQQQRLVNHHKKQQNQQKEKHQLCHSSDIDANQAINVSSHHPHHLQASRDCIQTNIVCEDGDEDEDDVEIEEEAEDGDDEDEIDSPNHKKQLGYTKLLVTFDRSSGRSSAAAQHKTSVTLTDFEADSESSDLETIQRCMRSCNQRNTNKSHYPPMPYKFLTNNGSSLLTGHSKRSTICESVTTINSVGLNASSELESCDMDGIQSIAAASEATATLFNEHLPHKYQHKQQQHYLQQQQQQQKITTLMAITKNVMTTGSTTSTTAQSLGSTVVTSTTSNNSVSQSNSNSVVSGSNNDSMSNTSSFGVVAIANAVANSQKNNNVIKTKLLADNEINQQHHLQHQQQYQHKINGVAMKQKNIAIISPNSHKNFNNKHSHHHHHHHGNNNNKSPTVLRKHHEHHHHSTDISKFNRSNRKSKNCAIFYFKHLDTDNETNYSNSNCGDDGHDDCHVIANNGGGGVGVNDHCYEDVDCVGVDVEVDDNDNDDTMGNDNFGGGLLSSSTASSSHTSDLAKSADVSSDDEGWLYTSSPLATNQQQHSIGGIESLNSHHILRASTEVLLIDGGIQSSTVSSSEAATSCAAAPLQRALSDNSDKQNKEVKSDYTTSLTQLVLAANQTFAASTTVVDSNSGSSSDTNANPAHLALNSGNPSGNSSSSSTMSSSCSSNDRFTEATTTASTKTITTQILKYPTRQQQQQRRQQNPPQFCSEMELQINNNNDRQQLLMKENILSATASSKSTPATNMPHLVINHKNNNNNNNCANSPPSLIANSPQHKQNHHHCASKTSSSQNTAASTAITAADNDANGNGNFEKENVRFYTRADICNINVRTPNPCNDNNNNYQQQQHQHQHQQQLANINGSPAAASHPLYGAQHLLHGNVGKRLPPRSPAKSSISHTSTNTNTSNISPTKGKVSHESIKQLVLEAEHLVRDEALKTPTKQKHSSSSNNNNNNNSGGNGNIVQISTTVKKREVIMPGPIKRVQEWLEHQPSTGVQMQKSSVPHHHSSEDQHRHLSTAISSIAPSPTRTDDCEASGEASETDSIPQHCSDTSEVSDSIATCMQTSTNSYGNSTERIGGSAEPIVNAATSNQSLNVKVVKRQQNRRKSERPWSVSCLSQLTTDASQVDAKANTISNVHSGLASHSISESALDSLSPGRPRASSSSAVTQVKSYDSKGSLKRRKTRKKKLSYMNGKKSDTNSEDNIHHNHHHALYNINHPTTYEEELTLTPNQPSTLLMQTCENMTPKQIQEIAQALMQLQNSNSTEQIQMATGILQQHQLSTMVLSGATNENEEENHLMKPNFRVGSYTTAYMTNEVRLGSLAALATYMNDEEQQGEYNTTGTEDHHSSFSETAWDNYQEKYNSENYSEGFDSDAARKLLEFGDDYRNFIDSQSDNCSSLSAANNLDSFSPPRMDSLQQNESKIITQDTIVSSVDHARRRRALELEYERRRKNLEIRRKSCQESLEYQNPKSPAVVALSSSTQALTPKNSERFNFQHRSETATRKLEFGMSHSAQSLRRTSESDTSQRRRKADERRRSSRNLEKCIKLIPATSSSSGDDTDDEKEIRNLLQQSHNRLEDTKALKIRCHLLRPEDYTEIINTCRDNIRCLESVLKGPTCSVLSSQCVTQSKDLLAAWEDLLSWSENAAAARKMQEDMIVLKHALNRLGNKSSFELLDTEPSIQIAIEALKNEKTQLQTYRTSMLKLNASVHSWLTRQERRLQNALVEQQLTEAAVKVSNELLEEKYELESEHQALTAKQQQNAVEITSNRQTLQEQIVETTAATKSETAAMITVTDSIGNQIESHTTTTAAASATTNTVGTSTSASSTQPQLMHSGSSCSGSEKNWDLQSLITSETEFHKHLKDEVSDMYTAWDEADARINTQLEVLTSSLIAWRQLECGLSEFQLALGQDRGTLKGLEGALNTGQATPGELAQNVKLVAKLLSEKVNVSQEQLSAVQDYLDPNHILYIAKFTASNGSLSDSGISDGGATSDGGLSERERRLGVLRRLAKQLESALAPGSEAMKSIAARMESAETELKSLQNTCRDLIVRTAASHQNKKQQMLQEFADKREEQTNENAVKSIQTNGNVKVLHEMNGKMKQSTQEENSANNLYASQTSPNKRNKRGNRHNSSNSDGVVPLGMLESNALQINATAAGDGGDDPSDDPSLAYDLDTSDDELTPSSKRGWGWRIAKIAVPMQLALFAVYCAANLMQPNCCDNINNFSMSFTPQLRYIRGPPPI